MKKLVTILLLVCFPAYADGLKYVPKWKMVNNLACYEFEDAKKLVEIDLRYGLLTDKEKTFTLAVEDYQSAATNFQKSLAIQKQSVDLLEKNNDDLAKRLLAETERANKAEASKPAWSTLVLGGAGLLLVGVVGGVLLGVYAAK